MSRWEIQSMLFSRDHWDPGAAAAYLHSHGIRPKKVDVTDNWLRFRLHPPSSFRRMRTIHLDEARGVRAIYGEVK